MNQIERQVNAVLQRLAFARLELMQWTQEELGSKIGVNKAQVGKIEKGMKVPQLTTLIRQSGAFGISMETLFKGTPGLDGRYPEFNWKQAEQQLKKLGVSSANLKHLRPPRIPEYTLYWALLLAEVYPDEFQGRVKGWLQRVIADAQVDE